MPATVKSRVGSSETSDAEGTTVWPRSAKKSSHRWRMSAVCMVPFWVPPGTSGHSKSVEWSVRGRRVGGLGLTAQLGIALVVALGDGVAERASLRVDRREEVAALLGLVDL